MCGMKMEIAFNCVALPWNRNSSGKTVVSYVFVHTLLFFLLQWKIWCLLFGSVLFIVPLVQREKCQQNKKVKKKKIVRLLVWWCEKFFFCDKLFHPSFCVRANNREWAFSSIETASHHNGNSELTSVGFHCWMSSEFSSCHNVTLKKKKNTISFLVCPKWKLAKLSTIGWFTLSCRNAFPTPFYSGERECIIAGCNFLLIFFYGRTLNFGPSAKNINHLLTL